MLLFIRKTLITKFFILARCKSLFRICLTKFMPTVIYSSKMTIITCSIVTKTYEDMTASELKF